MERLWAPWRLEYVQGADEQEGCGFCRAAEGDAEEQIVVHRGGRAVVLGGGEGRGVGRQPSHHGVSPGEVGEGGGTRAQDPGKDVTVRQGLSRHALRIAFVVLVALLVSGACLAIWDSRQTATTEYRSNQAKMGLVLAEQTTRALQVVDLVVQNLQDDVIDEHVDTPDHFRVFMSNEAMFQHLQARPEHMPQLESLVVLAATGRVTNSSRAWPPSGASEWDTDVFVHFENFTDNGPYSGLPQLSDVPKA